MQDSFDVNELPIQDLVVKGEIHDDEEPEEITYYPQDRELEPDEKKYVSIQNLVEVIIK